ncbi:MAG: molybdopterin-synthase adenylyltransferase MoeB [Myxococcota bacterium]|nr:molybdopterin-synthase adenylyltransferase MoeB [Myxococcota bacterium]
MTQSFQDLLAQAKAQITEISVQELQRLMGGQSAPLVVDIREPDERLGGVIPSATACPRGFLELRIEAIQPDRSAPIAVVCAGGTRSALAAQTLGLLDYRNVVSVAGGMGAWRRAGFDLEQRRQLEPAQVARYARQINLPQVGEGGQQTLLDARVLCVGAGGLGCPTALYLAAAGVGTIGIVDDDLADVSNLHRQILHGEDVVGMPKVDSAIKTLSRINSDIEIVPHNLRLNATNVLDVFEGYDIVVDGTDNFPTRYLINDACVFLGIPNVHGSIFHFDGQVTVFNPPGGGPCYRCLYPEPPPPELAPSCAEAGVLGAICGMVGAIQAAETMKLILGAGDVLGGRILYIDALKMIPRELKTRREPSCPVCGEDPTITEFVDYEQFCAGHQLAPSAIPNKPGPLSGDDLR